MLVITRGYFIKCFEHMQQMRISILWQANHVSGCNQIDPPQRAIYVASLVYDLSAEQWKKDIYLGVHPTS